MTTCLVALGSNLGDRAAMLDAAIRDLDSSPDVESLRASAWQLTLPVGGSATQREFLNGAALVETSLSARGLLTLLQEIETRHGRKRHERWGSRTLDLDLLLYGDAVVNSPELTVPHPRMSFRRFVLEPAVEIAAGVIHPTIGWTLERLVDHLDSGADRIAIVSRDESARHRLAATLGERYGANGCEPVAVDAPLWPASSTTWLEMPATHNSNGHPKLTVLLDDAVSEEGLGPTLRIGPVSRSEVECEIFAAIEAVWPRLGPLGS